MFRLFRLKHVYHIFVLTLLLFAILRCGSNLRFRFEMRSSCGKKAFHKINTALYQDFSGAVYQGDTGERKNSFSWFRENELQQFDMYQLVLEIERRTSDLCSAVKEFRITE